MGRVGPDTRSKVLGSWLIAGPLLLLGALSAAVLAKSPVADPEHKPAGQVEAGEHPKGEVAKLERELAKEEEPNALEHVMDARHEWELFQSFGPHELRLPVLLDWRSPAWGNEPITLSKFMILEVVAAVLVALIFIPVARRLRTGQPPKGGFLNTFEVLLTFIREEVAKPCIGHDADRYVPFLWTLFLFILFTNLLGLIPLCGSATASIYVTFGLALWAFIAIHGSGAKKLGFGPYVASMWPHFDVPYGMGYIIKPFVFAIEWMGVLVRNIVLAVRLFANMFAGHVVLATILIFIYTAGKLMVANEMGPAMWGTISVLSVVGQVMLSLLELFVAFLQAYIFTFLASLFMGMAMHPMH